jgi:hypothetical protein
MRFPTEYDDNLVAVKRFETWSWLFVEGRIGPPKLKRLINDRSMGSALS